MTARSRLISAEAAAELLAKGEAVRSGTAEHRQTMAGLWEQVARKLVFVVAAGAWFYRNSGADRVPLKEAAVQKMVDQRFHSDELVLTYGRNDRMVKAAYEAPQLSDVANALLEKTLEEHRGAKAKGPGPHQALLADFMDTCPGEDEIVALPDGNRAWNLWSKSGVRPTRPENYREPRWFLDVVERFFGEHHEEREYFLDWCAHLTCRPGTKMPVSVLLVSTLNGAGKAFIAKAMELMVGSRNCKNLTADTLKSGFQSYIMGTTLAVIHELYEQGNHGFADRLKTWQSEDTMFVNMKYGPQQNTRNMVHFLAFSNRSSPMHLEEGDRRWFTFASPEKNPAPREWWTDKWRFLKHPKTGLPDMSALGNLLRYFQLRMAEIERTGRFNPHERPPETDHKRGLVEDSRSQFYAAVREMLDGGRVPQVAGPGFTTLAEIEGELLRQGVRLPSNSQKRQDLESLGFTREKRKDGRFWRVPNGCNTVPNLDAVIASLAVPATVN
jgi:Family of unknown function (DUF5906)